jgi:hypothetical protein
MNLIIDKQIDTHNLEKINYLSVEYENMLKTSRNCN